MKNCDIGMNLETTIKKKLSSTDEPPNMQCKGEAKLYGPMILIRAIKFHLTCSLLNCWHIISVGQIRMNELI